MSVSATIHIGITVLETLTANESPLFDSTDARIKFSCKDNRVIDANSDPDATIHSDGQFELSPTDGVATIDFTDLTRRGGSPIDLVGTQLRAVSFKAPSENAGDITITEGASNGLALFGAGFVVVVKPGQTIAMSFDDDGPIVASGDRTIDLEGTGTDVLQMIAVAG
jgi:hypothetical protein